MTDRKRLTKRQRSWLKTISLCSTQTYPGIGQDFLPRNVAKHLLTDGLIKSFIPHNPVHEKRWVLTAAGRAELARKSK